MQKTLIKPQIGDWVKLVYRYNDGTRTTIEQLTGIFDNSFSFKSNINGRNSAPKERATITVWEPVVGEKVVAQLKAYIPNSAEPFTYNIVLNVSEVREESREAVLEDNSIISFNDIRPFIGHLPKFS